MLKLFEALPKASIFLVASFILFSGSFVFCEQGTLGAGKDSAGTLSKERPSMFSKGAASGFFKPNTVGASKPFAAKGAETTKAKEQLNEQGELEHLSEKELLEKLPAGLRAAVKQQMEEEKKRPNKNTEQVKED